MTDRPEPIAIFLTGTIGSGKTTLGLALAREIGGGHVEGDDYQQPPRAWFATALSTSRGVLEAVLAISGAGRAAVVSYPLRCREWIFYRRRLADAGIRSAFISLVADEEALLSEERGRRFSADEVRRIREMLQEGYGARTFADFAVRTDRGSVRETLADIAAGLDRLALLPPAARTRLRPPGGGRKD